MEKPNKRNCTLVKSYWVISLLNCPGKVVEKLVAEQLQSFVRQKESFIKVSWEEENSGQLLMLLHF